MATNTTGIKLDQATRERLYRLGEAKQRSTHWLMKDAISRYLETEERFEREKAEDEARYQRYLDTGTHTTQGEMNSWLDELAEAAERKVQAE